MLQRIPREIRVALNTHLGEDSAAVGGHALDGHAQRLRDLARALPAGEPVEHFEFAPRQALVRLIRTATDDPVRKEGRNLLADIAPSGRNRPHRNRDLPRRTALAQEPGCTKREHLECNLLGPLHGEHEDPKSGPQFAKLHHKVWATAGDPEVKHADIGLNRSDDSDRLVSVGCLANDNHVGTGFKQALDALAHNSVVVDEEHADQLANPLGENAKWPSGSVPQTEPNGRHNVHGGIAFTDALPGKGKTRCGNNRAGSTRPASRSRCRTGCHNQSPGGEEDSGCVAPPLGGFASEVLRNSHAGPIRTAAQMLRKLRPAM